jgi:hypothetical protein
MVLLFVCPHEHTKLLCFRNILGIYNFRPQSVLCELMSVFFIMCAVPYPEGLIFTIIKYTSELVIRTAWHRPDFNQSINQSIISNLCMYC